MASEKIVRDLYGGKYHMVHNPNARGRAPRYLVNDEIKPKGVTTIMGQTLFKDLMQWAVDSAMSIVRTKLPIVTEEDLEKASVEYKRLRDAGASTGSETHALVEQYLKGQVPVVDETTTEAMNAYLAFVKWFEEVKPEILGVEEVIYSPSFNYAGTYDCMLKIDGKVYLCDLKTTNISRNAPKGIYAENFIQLGGYALAHNEQCVEDKHLPRIDDLMVISAKKNGALDIQTASDLGITVIKAQTMFKNVLSLYNYMQDITNQLKEVKSE
jgi:hypothetical protein